MTLTNQRIVIIGGSSGIGLATAQQALQQGASLIIAGRSQEKLELAKERLASDAVEIYQLDNQNEDQLKAFFEHVGEFDHLFTPGASYVRGPITSDADIAHSCFKGKFWPQYNAAKYAVPYLSRNGSIVLMSGAFGQRPLSDGASYAACNGAIESLGKALAVELAPVRVNVVSPGTILTNFNWEGASAAKRLEAYHAYNDMCLLGRVGTAAEAAHTVLYLMTNGYTTGSTLFPDGGYILR
ncbi:SDR family oxidoreductase [Paenibacillus sp. SYP-B3998]|uniref:SDR family oxidoreductase n=1 Tax=Paenibacillus sp. SYP-B3998 TaxID=2678564 RepID=A0A6G4A0Q0_9BACL|nr:SDR family oxidoreductase [Paenibacillus sp. SYP-B3998]NEW07401.1 SDR family oxidoreductase [Paenibacillus sp. SYP-B3998]